MVSYRYDCLLLVCLLSLLLTGCGGSSSDSGKFTLNINTENGTVTRNPDQTQYAKGAIVTLTATPSQGYSFWKWSGDVTENGNPATITMDANKSVIANYTINITNENSVLSPPRNLTAVTSSNGIELNWRDTSANENHVVIERSDVDNTNFGVIESTGSNTTQFIDSTALSQNTTYFYRVASCDSNNECSTYSNVSATTPVVVPSAKISLETERTFSVENEIFFSAIGSIEESMTIDSYDYSADIRTAGENATDYNLASVDSLYEWDFGDGVVSGAGGGISVTHTYCQPGTYTVTLKVTHKGIEYTKSTVIIIGGDYYKTGPRPGASLLLNLSFEDMISDQSENDLSVAWGVTGEGNYEKGVEGKAVSLTDGKYLIIDDSNDILGGKTEFTLSFWIRKVNISDEQYTYIISKGNQNLQLRFMENSGLQGRITTDTLYTVANWGNLNNQAWHQVVLVYDANLTGDNMTFYVDGNIFTVAGDQDDGTKDCSGSVSLSTAPLIIGSDNNGENSPDILIDELRIFDKALSQDEISSGFELHHAEFHARIAQYIDVIIPGVFTQNSENRMQVVVTGGDLAEELPINDRSNLENREQFLLENYKLPGSEKDYILKVRILTEDGALLEEKSEPFYKPYDGIPATGIDENNSFRIKVDDPDYPQGKLFFPVTTCGLNSYNIEQNLWGYQTEGNDEFTSPLVDYVNAAFGEGFYPTERSISTWKQYLDISTPNNLKAMGPNDWPGLSYIYSYSAEQDAVSRTRRYQNSDVNKMAEYVKELKGNPSMMIWNWCDEPNFHDPVVIAPTLRSWTYACHQQDPEHPVMLAFMGWQWRAAGVEAERKTYEYCYNAKTFGQFIHPNYGTHVADVIAVDFYPTFQQEDLAFTDNARLMSNLKKETGNLIPLMSFIETPANNKPNWAAPTPEMLKMNIWQNVIHGSKAIGWFHYFQRTSEANFETMAEFILWLEELSPAVLGPELDIDVSVNYGSQEARIDTMIREYDGKIYLFSSRLNELIIEESSEPPEPVQNYDVTVSISIDGITATEANVFKEDRSVNISSGSFDDTFQPYEVHIYVIDRN